MDLTDLYHNNNISAWEWVLGRAIKRLGQCDDPWVGLAAALVSRSASQGNVCLDLALLHARGIGELTAEADRPFPISLDQWCRRLEVCSAVGAPGDFCPLILDGTRLYLHRYWSYEHDLAKQLLDRSGRIATFGDSDALERALVSLFTDPAGDQREAARRKVSAAFGICGQCRVLVQRR